MTKRPSLNPGQISDLLNLCRKEDLKTFTKTIKILEKENSSSYCIMNKEGIEIFQECARLFNESKNPIVQYNALRLAKYAVDHPEALGDKYREPWDLYIKTIFHADGRVRMAGIQLLDRYYFGLSFDIMPVNFWQGKRRKANPITMEEVGRFVVERYLYLQDLEEKYIEENQDKLDEDDLPNIAGQMPWASDTKDKFLKSIRMGLEVFFCRGPLEELMERYHYQEKTSDEFPDATIFQRYEQVSNRTGPSNSKTMKTYIIRVKLEHDKRTYRDIEIPENMKLYDVAKAILDSFNFDFDHLFGFGNRPGFYHSDIQYELKTEDDLLEQFGEENTRGDVEKTTLAEVPFFRQPKDKMYFLFDFGDDWRFEIELKTFGETAEGRKYPVILLVNGKAPKQYE